MAAHAQVGQKHDSRPGPFDALPDELVLAILRTLKDDVPSVLAWGATCMRHYVLAADELLWREFCRARFGYPIHNHAYAHGKDGRWIYRAQACVGDAYTPVGFVDRFTEIYCGDLVDGLPHGYGTSMQCTRRDLQREQHMPKRLEVDVHASHRYEGEWHMGQRHGHGECISADGSVHRNAWENDLRHGYGTITTAHGSHHVGVWHAGECRFGIITSMDGRSGYAGEWKDGRPNGYGTGRLENGAAYAGEYARGVRNGYGVYTCTDGTRIAGVWADDVLSGYAICTDPIAHARYEGMWGNNMSMGFGVQSYGDGSRLSALWSGVQHSCGNVASHRSSDKLGSRCIHDPCAACLALATGTSKLAQLLGRNTP